MADSGPVGRFAPDTAFGPFTIVRLLGAGGMGEVYLVRRRNIDRLDALKVLNDRADHDTARRFLREMQLASRLQHPHVVSVHDIGHAELRTNQEGPPSLQPWILMQYVEGTTLADLIHTAAPLPLAVDRSLGLLVQIADGLDAAHRVGIVHRDVKPDNVLVHCGPSGRDHAYVADLGIAEALDAHTRLTGRQGALGTPGYMSPERYLGSLALDARTDVYSLACMAFQMLSGKLPRDVSPGFQIVPLLSNVREGLGADTDAVLGRGLALDPEDRYASCPEFVAALGRALTTAPQGRVQVNPAAASERRTKPSTAGQTHNEQCDPGHRPPDDPPVAKTPLVPLQGRRTGVLVAAASAGILSCLGLAGVLLLNRSGDGRPHDARAALDTAPVASDAPPSASSTSTPSTATAVPVAPPAPAGPGDVRLQPAGLFCRDLQARGYSYSAAVDYWRMHGQPDQMDADRNGIPCETVYPVDRVADYFGGAGRTDDTGLPSGLFCRDLVAAGLSYPFAVAYWVDEGLPERMDADRNGIPCETVYSPSEVREYWAGS